MMARKNSSKAEARGSIVFDTRTKAVMAAETNQEDVKGKVQSVREVVPGKSNNEIILVLQYYDNNVERTIQAYLEDGAKEALTQWHFSGNKTANKRKKKNKAKPTNQQTQGKPTDQSQQPTTDTNHIDTRPDKPVTTTPPIVNGNHDVGSNSDSADLAASSTSTTSSPVSSSSTEPLPPRQLLPQRQRHQQSQPAPSGSGSHSHLSHPVRERTASEQSTSSVSSASGKSKKPHAGLEKSIKDLQRQTISIERYKRVLNEEVDRGCKRLKSVFEEMIQGLRDRQSVLQAEMDVVRIQAMETFAARQSQGADLKMRVDRAPKMTEAELNELRADIKHFVADRKMDEDLGKTTRFLYDSDHLLKEIKNFGEVVPVRCAYTKRRPSVASLVSQTSEPPTDTETSPSLTTTGPEALSTLTSTSSTSTPQATSSSRQGEIIDVQTTQEVADIQRRLRDSLRAQGLSVKSPPRYGRQPTPSAQQRSGSGDAEKSRPSGQRSGPPQRSEVSGGPSGPGGDDGKKSRNAKRRQRQRERQRESTNQNAQNSSNSSTHNSSPRQSQAKAAPTTGPNPHQSRAEIPKDSSSEGGVSGANDRPSPASETSHDATGPNPNRSRSPRKTSNSPIEDKDKDTSQTTKMAAKDTVSVNRNSATVSINGGGAGGEKHPVKRVEVIVNGDIHKD